MHLDRRRRGRFIVAVLTAAGIVALVPTGASGQSPLLRACGQVQWVASWTASPTDSSPTFAPSMQPTPSTMNRQTVRMVITPHFGGSLMRLHLSNRFAERPLVLGHVTVGAQSTPGAAVSRPATVTFGGAKNVTIAAGQDVLSDPVVLSVRPFVPVSVSVYVPGVLQPVTEHWNANATSYYAPSGSGDLTQQVSGSSFIQTTPSWFYVVGLDVQASAASVVAFGDSITDGFVGGSPLSLPVDPAVADKNGRYPDDLQRRVAAAGLPLSIVNAGIGSNQLLGTLGLFTGPSGVSRFANDALEIPAVSGVIVLEGINDLGLGSNVTPQDLEAGYTQLVTQAHAAGKRIWLATITPAANAIIDGTLFRPESESYRQQVNTWIRQQHLADGVIDFDAAIRDPAQPSQMAAAYSGPDHLHPNLAGYRKMAAAVPLRLLAPTATCP